MKKSFLKLTAIVFFQFAVIMAFGQMTGPEDPGGEPVGDPPLGGGAPLSGGTVILIILGAAYGGKKVYDLSKEKTENQLKKAD